MSRTSKEGRPAPAPPRAVAIVGIVFSAMYMTSLVLVRLALPADPTDPGGWLSDSGYRSSVQVALNLVPFTGIAFLWFMGVLRTRIGLLEDQFISTVFFGSGLLFVGLLFATVAVAGGILATFGAEGHPAATSETYALSRRISHVLMNTFAVKMAGVFMFVTSTIGLRTGIVPRWMVYLGYALALVMLVTITDFAWIAMVFPSWVLLVSAYILVTKSRPGEFPP
jgi:hypothetical protein